jgi:hypothetical protein
MTTPRPLALASATGWKQDPVSSPSAWASACNPMASWGCAFPSSEGHLSGRTASATLGYDFAVGSSGRLGLTSEFGVASGRAAGMVDRIGGMRFNAFSLRYTLGDVAAKGDSLSLAASRPVALTSGQATMTCRWRCPTEARCSSRWRSASPRRRGSSISLSNIPGLSASMHRSGWGRSTAPTRVIAPASGKRAACWASACASESSTGARSALPFARSGGTQDLASHCRCYGPAHNIPRTTPPASAGCPVTRPRRHGLLRL